jgi:hypothetical protein
VVFVPESTWNEVTIDGKEYLVIESAYFRVSKDWDADSQMFLAVAAPTGGLGSFPALVKGDKGDTPALNNVNYTVLEADDPTADTASFTETAPGQYDFDLTIHKGPQGDPGDTIVTPSDFSDTPVVGYVPVVNSELSSFDLAPVKAGDRYIPASIASAPSGQPTYTLASVAIPAQPFDWRPEAFGQVLATTTNNNCDLDLVARLDIDGLSEETGPIVGRGFSFQSYGIYKRLLSLSSGPPAAASADYDKVSAGYAATVHLRLERQSGTGTFTTQASKTHFCVRVRPIP